MAARAVSRSSCHETGTISALSCAELGNSRSGGGLSGIIPYILACCSWSQGVLWAKRSSSSGSARGRRYYPSYN